MKYFVLGALASGFLLYGMSMVYGATGSLDIPDIVEKIAAGQVSEAVLVFGVVFVVAGIAFKFGAVPFHMWMPDVYQGTATVATLLIAAGPKLAAFALAFRLLGEALMSVSGGLAPDADRAGGPVAGAGQHRGHRPDQPQADARLFDHLAGRLRAARA